MRTDTKMVKVSEKTTSWCFQIKNTKRAMVICAGNVFSRVRKKQNTAKQTKLGYVTDGLDKQTRVKMNV